MESKNSERIIRKIERCLALGKSANENEAATAMRQAKMLMEKYAITEMCIELNAIEIAADEKAKSTRVPPAWVRLICSTVAAAFSCSVYFRGGQVMFVGRKPSASIALYTKEVLERQVEIAKKQYIQNIEADVGGTISRNAKIRLGKAFKEGWAIGCKVAVDKFASSLSVEEKAMHDTKAKEAAEKMGVGFGSAPEPKYSHKTELGMMAARSGLKQGEQVQIHAGMSADERFLLS